MFTIISKASCGNQNESLSVKIEDKETNKSASYNLLHTKHSQLRSAQRGINAKKIAVALQYGEIICKQGFEYYILGTQNIPENLIKDKDELKNTVVVVATDSGSIITCYRTKSPFKHIKKKSKSLYK